MAFLGVRVPHEIARLLSGIDVPGKKEPVDHFHITMLYVGDEVPIQKLTSIVEATFDVVQQTKPFTVATDTVTSFDPHPEHGTVPIICRIESPELHALVADLKAAFDERGVFYDKKFPVYKPHVTLSYLDGPPKPADREIPEVEWGVGEIVLWGGDSGDERLVVTFPFALALRKAAMYRAYVKLACESAQGGCQCEKPCPCDRGRSRA